MSKVKQHKDDKGYDINIGDGILYLKEEGHTLFASGNIITGFKRDGTPIRTKVVSFPFEFEASDGRQVNAVNVKRSKYQ